MKFFRKFLYYICKTNINKMKTIETIINYIKLVKNIIKDILNWNLLKKNGYTFSKMISEEIEKKNKRQEWIDKLY